MIHLPKSKLSFPFHDLSTSTHPILSSLINPFTTLFLSPTLPPAFPSFLRKKKSKSSSSSSSKHSIVPSSSSASTSKRQPEDDQEERGVEAPGSDGKAGKKNDYLDTRTEAERRFEEIRLRRVSSFVG